MTKPEEIAAEQALTDMLFARLDGEVAQARQRLERVSLNLDPANPKAESLVERETDYHALNDKLDRLGIAELGLVFGRIDVEDPNVVGDNPVPGHPELDRRYIGRMGLDDRDNNYRTLLLDWRAPMARPFYLATTARPEGVTLRRHIRTRGRDVTGLDDEYLSGDGAATRATGPGEETALYQAMQRARTEHMSEIVETIQREQDEIIRDPTRGVMVVEGGPGTGKTAVALHRVAWLLYTWREQLSRTGVLILGPNSRFLDYISHVLPELGETGVVLSTIGSLYPGIAPKHTEDLLTREIKGSEEMVSILLEAVRAYQVIPEKTMPLRVDSITLEVSPEMVKRARTRARRSRKAHNDARPIFREHLVGQLAEQLANRIGADPMGAGNLLSRADIDALHDDLLAEPVVAELIEDYWPALTPEGVLANLVSSREAIAVAAHDYDEETRAALYRETPEEWAPSDAALLDELATLIGIPDPSQREQDVKDQVARSVSEAQDALDILKGSEFTDNDEEFDAEYLSAFDVIDAETLAERQEVTDDRSTAERAAADHTWAYGHVIIDEAQELTPMEWRMVFRRSPSKWMTLVGDISQTGSPAGVDTWEETLFPFVGDRVRRHELTVNYRTPSEVAEVSSRLLAAINPEASAPRAIRESGHPVQYLPAGTDPSTVVDALTAEDPERSTAIVNVDNVESMKGLEFDHVIIVDPARIAAVEPQGLENLYVAITRATQSLTFIGELPDITGRYEQ